MRSGAELRTENVRTTDSVNTVGARAGGRVEREGEKSGCWRDPAAQREPRVAGRLSQRPGREGSPALRARRTRPARTTHRPTVDALVAQHMLAAPEALAALPTGKGPRARVRLAVAHQVLAPVEGLAALAAGVWLLTSRQRAQGRSGAAGVCAAVASQVLLASEGLSTLGAGMWLLGRVTLSVAQQVRWLQGNHAALGAGRGARGSQKGRQDGRGWRRWGAAGFLLVGTGGLGVPCC